MGSLFDIWFHVDHTLPKFKVWRMAFFFAEVWSIWKVKNKTVFKQDAFDKDEYSEMVRFNLAW